MFFKLFFIALPIFMAMDLLWLGVLAKNFYRQQLGELMSPDINWTAAIIFYLVFISGLVFFVIFPAVEKNYWTQAFWWGIFFGVITYATYDLTNLATLKNWPILMTCVDIAWGGVIAASVSTATYYIYTKIS